MSPNTGKTNRIYFVIAAVVTMFMTVPLYQHGQPWLKYHQENLVIYDCRLHSDSVPVGSKYPGRIAELLVQIGQHVQAGDTIACLDIRELDALTDKANATVELAKANVAAEKVAIEKALASMIAQQECLVAKSQVAASRAKAIKEETKWIEKQLIRAKKLAKRGSMSQADVERLLREFESFDNKARIAGEEDLIANLDLAAVKIKIDEIQSRNARIVVLEHEIAIAKSELKSIDEQKDSAMIKSKTSGVVTNIFRGAGSSVKVGDPIIQIQDSNVWCEAWIDEKKFANVDLDARTIVSLKAYPNSTIQGTVTGFLPTTEAAHRVPQLTENPVLQPNSKVCIKIKLSPTKNLTLLAGLTGKAVIAKDSNKERFVQQRLPHFLHLAHNN